MRDNSFIETGYRPPLPTWYACLMSALFQLHNETVNVWSHLFGATIFLRILVVRIIPSLLAVSSSPIDPASNAVSQVLRKAHDGGILNLSGSDAVDTAHRLIEAEHARMMLPLVFAALSCMGMSAAYHALWVRSSSANSILSKLDYIGIAMLCTGHAVSSIRIGFYCAPPAETTWSLTIVRVYLFSTFVTAMVVVRAVTSPSFGGSNPKAARTAAFMALGGVLIFPMFHLAHLHSWTHPEFTSSLMWMVSSLLFYAIGGIIYAVKAPECCRPGKYDIFCSSHQIMHLLVICGAVTHYIGLDRDLAGRLHHGCSLSPL